MSKTQHIGRVIRERRLDLGMTQRKVAHESNISIRGLEEIELGDVDPKCSTVFRIAVVLRMDVGDFNVCLPAVALMIK